MSRALEETIPLTHKPRVVIVGGGFAGITLAKRLDNRLFQTVIVDRRNHHVFQPLLYQVAAAGLAPEAICSPIRKIVERKRDVHFRMVSAKRVLPDRDVLETEAGTLRFDYLVIASGSATRFFGDADFEQRTFPLKGIDDALRLRHHLFRTLERSLLTTDARAREAAMNVVVIGGGPTGVEVAGAIAELRRHVLGKEYPDLDMDKLRITLVEGGPRLLPDMSEKAGIRALTYLNRLEVGVRLERRATHYDGEVMQLDDGTTLSSKTVVWAAGVKPAPVPGLQPKDAEESRIEVNAANQVLSGKQGLCHERIFVLGDAALMRTSDWPDGLPGMASVAIQQGRHLAKNLKRFRAGRAPKPFAFVDKGTMATVGRNRAVAELGRRLLVSGFFGWITWMVVHLWYLIGFRNKIIVSIEWIWNYFTYDRGVRAIIHPSSDDDT